MEEGGVIDDVLEVYQEQTGGGADEAETEYIN